MRTAIVLCGLAMATVAIPTSDLYQTRQFLGKSIADNSADSQNFGFKEPQVLSADTIYISMADTGNIGFEKSQDYSADTIYISMADTGNIDFDKSQDYSADTETLGFLEPQVVEDNGDFGAIMLDLLPEFSDILKKFGGSNGVQLGSNEMISAFFPIIRKAVEAKAQSENRELTDEEVKSLNLSETSISLATGIIGSINEDDSASKIIKTLISIARPIMEANAANEDRLLSGEEAQQLSQIENGVDFALNTMRDMQNDNSTAGFIASTLDVARFSMESRAKLEGRPLTFEEEAYLARAANAIHVTFSLMNDFNSIENNIADMVPIFMRISKFIVEARAQNESRLVTHEEEEFLRFTESTMTGALDFMQGIINGELSEIDIEKFMSTTRSLFDHNARSKGRTSLSPEDEDNLEMTEQVLGLALSIMRDLPSGLFDSTKVSEDI